MILLFLLQACSTASLESPVSAFLQPIHKTFLSVNEQNYQTADLLDNDGNIYITYWQVGNESLKSFNDTLQECRESIKSKKILHNSTLISEINLEDIKPLLFKEFNLCIGKLRFIHKHSDAFYPEKFKLSIFRGHSTDGQYLPVGSVFYIYKKSTIFKDVLINVKGCEVDIKNTDRKGINEIISSGYSYVSIESYIDIMKLCLERHNYILKND